MGLKNVEPEEQERFKELNRLRMKLWRDKKRKLKYAHRGKYRQDESVTPKNTESKQT